MVWQLLWLCTGKKLLEGTPGNGIFRNAASVFAFPGATIVHEEVVSASPGASTAPVTEPPGSSGLAALCAAIGDTVPAACEAILPNVGARFRTDPLEALGGGPPKKLHQCLHAMKAVPAFCRLDAAQYHSCALHRYVVRLDDVFIYFGSSPDTSIFSANGTVLPTYPVSAPRRPPRLGPASPPRPVRL